MNTKIEVYDNITMFAEALSRRKVNKEFAKWHGHDLPSLRYDKKFFGTNTYDEADNLLRYGYKEGLDKLLNVPVRKNVLTGHGLRPRTFNDVVGHAPHVPNMLIGIPQSMINTRRIPVKQKVLTVVLEASVDYRKSEDEIITVNANFLSAIISLEKAGYRINLYLSRIVRDKKNKAIGFVVKIKDSGQYMDTLKMAYPMIHPSFRRRHGFRYTETTDEKKLENVIIEKQGLSVVYESDLKKYINETSIKYDKCFTFYNLQGRTVKQITEMLLK